MNDPLPPGETTRVQARRALVLAAHCDDETLGCGGLLAQLAADGCRVSVLFVSDSGADSGELGRAEYSELRRREAEAAANVLGVAESRHAGLRDGALADELGKVGDAIQEALSEEKPDLLLVPSPLEATSDHRALFAALHRLLGPIRSGDALEPRVEDLRILAYEVNRPCYPDLLVDVSGELEVVERAMACYASQQARHDYLAAYRGIGSYRTLSLPSEVISAEAYRELSLHDFTTHSETQLIRELGGLPEVLAVEEGPLVSVVVRTRDRPQLLAEALESLAEGSYRRVEVVLVNDGGSRPSVPTGFPFEVVRVDHGESRGRAAAAQAGVAAASGDFVCFLDDDDLAAPEHLATLAGLASASGVRVAYTDAAVAVYELGDGGGWRCVERRLPYSRDFSPEILLLDNYIPFNTLIIERSLFAEVGAFDPELPFFEDWDFLIRLAKKTTFHHLPRVTCEYRHFRGSDHHVLGGEERRKDFLEVKAEVLRKHADLLTPEVLSKAVDALRAEAVTAQEGERGARRERDEAAELAQEQEARAHRLNGEVQSLRAAVQGLEGERDAVSVEYESLKAEHGAASAEVVRLQAEEARLIADVESQSTTLAETYAEIERLGGEIERLLGLIRAMEGTRAWRLHEWFERRKR